MRKVALLVAVVVSFFSAHRIAVAQVQELPMVPMATGGWQEKFWTHSDGTKFHYFEMGTGTPVILIHGSGGTALNWMQNGFGPSIARTNRVLAIDMRGHGQTVGPDGKRQQRTPNMDLDVLAFMDAMGITRAHIAVHLRRPHAPPAGRPGVATAADKCNRWLAGSLKRENSLLRCLGQIDERELLLRK